MHKPKQIEINIPKPCNQPWEEMTPCGQGRFCGHCQKTVIDFTAWSDRALYDFFSKDTSSVCGRFLSTQTNRPILIPPQPHSRLYRMTIALGLTLLFTQPTDVLAQSRPPRVSQNTSQNPTNNQTTTNGYGGEISGRVFGQDNLPLYNAVIKVSQGGTLKKEVRTNIDGKYIVQLSEPGNYDIVTMHVDYEPSDNHKLMFPPENKSILNFSLSTPYNPGKTVITGGAEPSYAPVLGKPKYHKVPRRDRESRKHYKK